MGETSTGWRAKLVGKSWSETPMAERQSTLFMAYMSIVIMPLYLVAKLLLGTLPSLFQYGPIVVAEAMAILLIFAIVSGAAGGLVMERAGRFRIIDGILTAGIVFAALEVSWDSLVVGLSNVSLRPVLIEWLAGFVLAVIVGLIAVRLAITTTAPKGRDA